MAFPDDAMWRKIIPSKVSFFLWNAILGKILTVVCPINRGERMASICMMCKGKNVWHLVMHCRFERSLWSRFIIFFGISWVAAEPLKALVRSWSVKGLGPKVSDVVNASSSYMLGIKERKEWENFSGKKSSVDVVERRVTVILGHWASVVNDLLM